MEYDEVVQRMAPCGLDCSRCADHQTGEIGELSKKLLELVDGYERVAAIKSKMIPAFEGFGNFKEVLNIFSAASCGGCRSGNVKCPIHCHVKACCKGHDIDFCFQCKEYPCSKEMDERLTARWMEKNDRMKEIGVVNFYQEERKQPRYK